MRADILNPNSQCTWPRAEIVILAIVKLHVAFLAEVMAAIAKENPKLCQRETILMFYCCWTNFVFANSIHVS